MKNKNRETNTSSKIQTKHFADNLIIKLAALVVVATSACASLTGGFNRNTVANLIDKDKRYSKPATMTINIGRAAGSRIGIPQMTADETAEQAIPRAREAFAADQPNLIVAEQMGFITISFENGELSERPMGAPRYGDQLGYWQFRNRVEITDAGKKLWSDLNLPADEDNLPLAVRGTPEVTGMKDENQTMKSVDFTYRWQANELGRAFNENSAVFKNLSPEVQQFLKGTKFDLLGQGNNRIMDFDVPRAARAFFQKFDDGWRLGQLYFM